MHPNHNALFHGLRRISWGMAIALGGVGLGVPAMASSPPPEPPPVSRDAVVREAAWDGTPNGVPDAAFDNAVPALLPSATPPLAPLDDTAVADLVAALSMGIDNWFGLAGIAKAPAPPPFSDALQAYRQAWQHHEGAPFLGYWHADESYAYSLTVYPAIAANQLCIVEFKPEWSLTILNEVTGETVKDVISEQILSVSVAVVEGEQWRSSQLQSAIAAMVTTPYTVGEPYPVALMAVRNTADTHRVVAAAAPPMLPPDLPEALEPWVMQALAVQGCITDDTSPQP